MLLTSCFTLRNIEVQQVVDDAAAIQNADQLVARSLQNVLATRSLNGSFSMVTCQPCMLFLGQTLPPVSLAYSWVNLVYVV